MTRYLFIALAGLFAGVGGVGCSAGVDESEVAVGEDVGETAEALPFNCVGRCVAGYKACIQSGWPYADCAMEREMCKDECDAQTCEPHEPGCCQGQPTCW